MPTEVSEIEKIIKGKLEEETKKSTAELVSRMASETQQAIDRINGVYDSAISTLKKLELTDATVFEFFEKTQGNIRIYEVKDRGGSLRLDVSSRDLAYDERGNLVIPPISIHDGKTYKIILMAIEQPKPVETKG